MAKKPSIDCSILDATLSKLASDLAKRGDVKTLDETVAKIQEFNQTVTRKEIVDGITNHRRWLASQRAERAQSVVSKIRSEAKTESGLSNLADRIEKQIANGDFAPDAPAKAKKQANDTIEALRARVSRLKTQKGLEQSILDLKADLASSSPFPAMDPPQRNKAKKFDRELELIRAEKTMLLARRNAFLDDNQGQSSNVLDIISNLPRSLQTGAELSFLLRQGGKVLKTRPTAFFKALSPMAKAMMGGDVEATRLWNKLEDSPKFREYILSGLAMDAPGSPSNEMFKGNLQHKIPLFGRVFKSTERGFNVFMNYARAHAYDLMVKPTMSHENKQAIAHMINIMTGKGSMKGLDGALNAANHVMFAPRYELSKWQFAAEAVDAFAGGHLKQLVGEKTGTRPMTESGALASRKDLREYRAVMRGNMVRYFLSQSAILGLVALAKAGLGDDEEELIEIDPRSSQFGKAKIGNTYVDIAEGMMRPLALIATLATGQKKSVSSGKITNIRDASAPWDDPDMKKDKSPFAGSGAEVIGSYARGKAAPIVSAGVDLVSGEDIVGNKQDWWSIAQDLMGPITYFSMIESMDENGIPKGLSTGIMDAIGIGSTTINKNRNKEAIGSYERALKLFREGPEAAQ